MSAKSSLLQVTHVLKRGSTFVLFSFQEILLAITFCFVSYMVIINVDRAGYARFLHDVLLLSVFWCHLLNCSFWFCMRLDLLTIE